MSWADHSASTDATEPAQHTEAELLGLVQGVRARPGSHETKRTGKQRNGPIRLRPDLPGKVLLDHGMVDFERRGFAIADSGDRHHLEQRAGAFITGFNIAARSWPDPHEELGTVPGHLRGFAYEGAAMNARLNRLHQRSGGSRFERLLDGPGGRYVHLIHVGFGWARTGLGLPFVDALPPTGLLRWLVLDGEGFAKMFFGGQPVLRFYVRHADRPDLAVRLAGMGRALWFAECCVTDAIADRIAAQPVAARSHLWAGIGLAAAYAGSSTDSTVDELAAASGPYVSHLAQGTAFAAKASVLSGVVPASVERMTEALFGRDPETVALITERTAVDLLHRPDARSYETWRSRIRNEAEQ